jgi:hypothetical protein
MKKLLFAILSLLFIIYFLSFPEQAAAASSRGLTLWFTQILPTLLPFSVLSYVVLCSGLLNCGKKGINREGYVLLCGFCFGFPIGCKLACDLYKKSELSRRNAEILCCFANNLSPFYVSSALAMLGLTNRGIIFLLLYGIPLLLCIISLFAFGDAGLKRKKSASGFHLDMQIVDAGIINGFETLIKICGYIMLFSMLSEILKAVTPDRTGLLLIGCTEVTNGISSLQNAGLGSGITCMLALLFLSLNGLSGLAQTASLLRETDLSVLCYIRAKLLSTGIIMVCGAILLCLGFLV